MEGSGGLSSSSQLEDYSEGHFISYDPWDDQMDMTEDDMATFMAEDTYSDIGDPHSTESGPEEHHGRSILGGMARRAMEIILEGILPEGYLTDSDVEASLLEARQTPVYFCNVCCRLLYGNTLTVLTIDPRVAQEQGITMNNIMAHLNEQWGNPLAPKVNNVRIPAVMDPVELTSLEWSDMKYVCPIMTFSNFQAPSQNRLAFPQLNGAVSMYRSAQFLSTADGMSTFAQDQTVPHMDRHRVVNAWNWLNTNNHLFRNMQQQQAQLQAVVEELYELEEDEDISNAVPHPGRYHFPTGIIQMPDPGPRMADVGIEQVNVAINPLTDQLVKYSNPNLMGLLFPELYPFGQDFFKLEHHKKNLRPAVDQGDPTFSIKAYAKEPN
ncbi:hypothetical protein BG000_004447 [Podila horticola]|nr:hypothetical protein BG000_004447 [Podila horticola]